MLDTARGSCLSDDRSDKFILQPEPLTCDIKKLRDWQIFRLWSISSAITTSRGNVLWRSRHRRGRQINRQLIQVYRRYQTAALSIQQAPDFFRWGWVPRSVATDLTMTGLTEAPYDFLRFCDSTIQWSTLYRLRRPLSQVSKAYLRTRCILFFHAVPLSSFSAAFSCSPTPPRPSPTAASSPLCTSAWFGFSFLSFSALLGPRPL